MINARNGRESQALARIIRQKSCSPTIRSQYQNRMTGPRRLTAF